MLIDKLAWIYLKDGKILSTLSKGKDTRYIPGGKREKKETDRQALYREIKEELSVELIENTFEYYGTFQAQAHGKQWWVIVQMTCYFAEYDGILEASSEIQDYDWFSYKDKDRSSDVDKLIFEDLYKKWLIDNIDG